MVSIETMIKQLSALLGTDDLTDWEDDFVYYIRNMMLNEKAVLSNGQTETLKMIWKRHFVG